MLLPTVVSFSDEVLPGAKQEPNNDLCRFANHARTTPDIINVCNFEGNKRSNQVVFEKLRKVNPEHRKVFAEDFCSETQTQSHITVKQA